MATQPRLRDHGRPSDAEMGPEREAPFSTISGEPVKPLYTEADLPGDLEQAIGLPGEFPYTRGVYRSMYRGRLWTMRQFAGFGTAAETNARLRYRESWRGWLRWPLGQLRRRMGRSSGVGGRAQ